MVQRQVLVHALDAGHKFFEDFLEERLHALKCDLLLECNRIAASRELAIQQKLNDACMQNEALKEKLRSITRHAEDASSQQVSPIRPKEIRSSFTASQDTGCSSQQTRASRTLHELQSEGFKLWGEYEDTAQEDEDEDDSKDELESAHWASQRWIKDIIAYDGGVHRRSPYTLNPYSTKSIAWEVVGIPILFYDLVTIPMQVFFHREEDDVVYTSLAWVIILYWTLDILLRLSIIGKVTTEGEVILDRTRIVKHYLRRSFLFDCFMVIPDWVSKVIEHDGVRNVAVLRLIRVLRLMRLFRMQKMKKITRNIEDMIDSEYFSVIVSILVNLLAILGVCHYLGCLWYLLGTWDVTLPHLYEHSPHWVQAQNLESAAWEYKYLVSFHWALVQFTPGSSNVKPVNLLEEAAECMALVFGLVCCSLFISALLQARNRLKDLSSKVDRDNWVLRRYLRQQGVSTNLQIRTMRYVEKCVEPMLMHLQRKDVSLLPFLSRPLQLEVLQEQYFHTLIAHPFFNSLRQRSLGLTLNLFVNVIIEILLADSDLLFENGSVSHEMFLVSKGALGYLPHRGSQIQHVEAGCWCSESVLWVAWMHNGTAKAAAASRVISIDSAKMRAGILEHKERIYASRCARAYLKDLQELASRGDVINDTTQVTKVLMASSYADAILCKGEVHSTTLLGTLSCPSALFSSNSEVQSTSM